MLGVKSRQLLRVFGADCTLANVTAETVDRFIATRLREGASRSTVHKELTTLRGALKLARRHGRFPRDVASVMPLDFSIRYKPRERALSFSEIDRLLGELTPPKRAIVAFLLATGATYPSELANLRRSDVDLETWSVRLRGTKRASRDRTVPIVPWAREWVGLAMPHLPFARWTNIRRDLHQACDRARIGRVSPNDLRRTAATLLRTAGIEPHLIGRFLGHGDSRMAERVYGRLRDETFADLLESRLAMSTKRAQFSEKPSKKAEK
jgi:integrase